MFRRLAKGFLISLALGATPLYGAVSLPWDVSSELTERVHFRAPTGQQVTFDLLSYDVEEEALLVRVNVQVRDVSGALISDEIVEMAHWLPRTHYLVDYDAWGWGTAEYAHTPLCVAHARFARQLENHLEQAVNI
jgi:hypothetical protein